MLDKHILVTGAAGFIGYHLSQHLCNNGFSVVGLDAMNNYYDVSLKKSRLKQLMTNAKFQFVCFDLLDRDSLYGLFEKNNFQYVINLAAQAGVRYSISNPHAYIDSNVHGFLNLLEACRHHCPAHLIYASSSSVYGSNREMPFSVSQRVDHPLSLYAATKRTNELMAYTYSSLYKLPTTGLRFFTAYGPYGRPDMALFIFTKSIFENTPIDVYNFGKMKRDFTYVGDVVEAITKLLPKIPTQKEQQDYEHTGTAPAFVPHRIFNIGSSKPIDLLDFIELLEQKLKKKAIKNFLPIQAGDVPETFSDNEALRKEIDFYPKVSIQEGIGKFVDWYRDYYKI